MVEAVSCVTIWRLVSFSTVRPSGCSFVATVRVALSGVWRSGRPDVAASWVPGGIPRFWRLGFLDVCSPRSSWGPRHPVPGHPVRISASSISSISFRPFWTVAFLRSRQAGCLPAVWKSGFLSACRQCVPSTAWPVSRVVGFGRLSSCPITWRNTGRNYPGTRRSVFFTASSCCFPTPRGRPALCLPVRESVLATVQKRSSVSVSQEADSSEGT